MKNTPHNLVMSGVKIDPTSSSYSSSSIVLDKILAFEDEYDDEDDSHQQI